MAAMKKRKLSLNRRLSLIALSALVPLVVLVGYLLYTINATNHAFDQVANSVTYAYIYAAEFKERVDYTMHYAITKGEMSNELDETATVNGIKIVNPYRYIDELRNACDVMSEVATAKSNENRAVRIKNTLNSLEKQIREIDENLKISGNYEQNNHLLEKNVKPQTASILKALQDYINVEAASLATVKEELMAKSTQTYQICISVVCIVTLLTVVLSILASQSVARPIQELCKMSKKVAKGDFSAKTEVTSEAEDEIAVLTNSFNDMTAEIGHLVEDIKREQANLRVMESKLLQAQINPHFLYNTLDTIVWLAEEKQTDEVVMMVTRLSEFFRTTLSQGRDYITVEEEKRHVDSYLQIQQFRYQDIMDYEIDIEEDILDYTLPKLTLQPLVENALYHGIKNKRGKGTITIKGFRKDNKIVLKVIDNGKGMTETELDGLRRYIAGYKENMTHGFGLANVNQRIHYYYGEEYGIFYESAENKGTEAVIILPAKNITQKS